MSECCSFVTRRISVSLTSNETSKAFLVFAVMQNEDLVILKLLIFEETLGENSCGYAQSCVVPSRLCRLKKGCATPKEQKMPHPLCVIGGAAFQLEENCDTLEITR